MSSLRLGFVTPSLMYRDGDEVWTNTGLGRLIEAVASKVGRVTLASSFVDARQDQHDHLLRLPAKAIHFLPSMPSMAQGLTLGRAVRSIVRDVEGASDVVVVQLPFSAPRGLLNPRRPRVYHVCADIRGVVGASSYYRGFRRVAARSAALLVDGVQTYLMRSRGSATVTNGRALLEHYAPRQGRYVVSSTLKDAEIGSVTRLRPTGGPFRILFVGMLRPEKGIDVLLDAFDTLVAKGADIELQLIGGTDAAELGAAEDMHRRLERSGSRVRFGGHLPFGPRLFSAYAEADVLVVPSRSEGTPRVLVEARAFGCPVIGTRVGGIPTSISDGEDGLLIAPDDASGLAAAIDRVRSEDALRARLVAGGYVRARMTTVDAQAEAIVAEARRLKGDV